MRKRLPILAVLLALTLIAAACGESTEDTTTTAAQTTTTAASGTTQPAETTTTEAAGPTTIIIGTTDTVSSLDAADAYAIRDWEVLRNIGEGLIKWQPGSAEVIVPGIAEDLPEISDDGLTYTLTLRDGVMFGDGLELTAPMLADQLNRLYTLSPDGPNAVGLTLTSPYVESISAVDDRTIQFKLLTPLAFFPQVLAGAPYTPTHPDIFTQAELNLFPDVPIYGVGPWTVTEFVPQEQMVFEPNEFYYGDRPKLDRVIIRHFETPQAMADAVRTGEIDVAWRILGSELATQLEDVDGLNVANVSETSIRYLIVNHAEGFVTADPNVRKALAALIDRDEISDVVYGGATGPLYSPVPPGFLGANEAFDDLYGAPNLDLAAELLRASGYSEDNKLQLDFAWPPEHYGATTADASLIIVEQLEAGGLIDVNPIVQEWSTYIGAVVGGEEWPLSVLGWFFDFPDAENYIQPFIENGGTGTMVEDRDGVRAPSVGQDLLDLLAAQRGETDTAARGKIIEDLQNAYADEVVTIPLYTEPEYIVYRDGVMGDSAFPLPDKLNIGPTIEFHYELLSLEG